MLSNAYIPFGKGLSSVLLEARGVARPNTMPEQVDGLCVNGSDRDHCEENDHSTHHYFFFFPLFFLIKPEDTASTLDCKQPMLPVPILTMQLFVRRTCHSSQSRFSGSSFVLLSLYALYQLWIALHTLGEAQRVF